MKRPRSLALIAVMVLFVLSFSGGRAAAVTSGSGPTAQGNTPPTPPTALTASPAGAGKATLQWTASTDAETASSGLTYILRVGTTPGGSDIIPIQNIGKTTVYTLILLPDDTYYWSVQASDSLATSSFAADSSFALGGTIFASWSNTSGAAGATNLKVTLSTLLGASGHFEYQLLAPGTPGAPATCRNNAIPAVSVREFNMVFMVACL